MPGCPGQSVTRRPPPSCSGAPSAAAAAGNMAFRVRSGPGPGAWRVVAPLSAFTERASERADSSG